MESPVAICAAVFVIGDRKATGGIAPAVVADLVKRDIARHGPGDTLELTSRGEHLFATIKSQNKLTPDEILGEFN